ncbi:MAG TPA: prolyl oligopeptidase family serine peptidase [Caulobacteraceae bacterium]|nr:prolyl oligopeptidase family serine peptidase [Caulobacteraceae bacterium]
MTRPADAAAVPSAHDFARAAQISDVSISPDGKHIVALRSLDGVHVDIAVWETEARDKPPTILAAIPQLTIMQVGFVKNDRLAVRVRQLGDIGSDHFHLFKLFLTDLKGSSWKSALPEPTDPRLTADERMYLSLADPVLLSSLPNDPRHILVVDQRFTGAGDVYKVDVYTGVSERVLRGSERFGQPMADLNGEVRVRSEVNTDSGKAYLAQWIRSADGSWSEHFRLYAKDRQGTQVVGFSQDPNIAYVSVTKDRDRAAIYEYDIARKKLLDLVFEHRLFDVGAPIQARDGRLLGFTYEAEKGRMYFTDGKLASMEAGVAAALGVKPQVVQWKDPASDLVANLPVENAFGAHLTSWSDDFSYAIVEKSGPDQPPEYYLLAGGARLTLLGRSRPQIDTSTLGDSALVEYAARDGLMIPALLHKPNPALYGQGPYPAIVLPHGGPWGRDELDWDISGWTKYFTARGFVVIQPQFRGSEGWGQKLWRAGDREWGQKMQDDNDDAAKWLIDQHLADPRRIAFFGYSYGGYAAFAAAIRPNGLYQCSIAGAGVADIRNFQGETYNDRFLREYQRPSIEGLNVLQHAREASIPVFIYNGDRDQTVDPSESHHFRDALKAAGKPYRYLEIKDMGHQYVTMTPADLELQLTEIEKFLKTDCKPGGL